MRFHWATRTALVAVFIGVGLPILPVRAADPAYPVKVVMSVAGWKAPDAPQVKAGDYFDDELLSAIYSSSFADVYRLAMTTDTLQDGSGYMLGYDVVIGGQDSCELKDVRFDVRSAVSGVTPIAVYFDAVSCFGHKPDESEPQTIFHVIEEDGRFVIDNLWSEDYRNGSVETSIKAQFAGFTSDYLNFRLTGVWPKY